MDPITCCLLGICCPPLQRVQRITTYIASFGVADESAQKIAHDLIAKVDVLMGTPFGMFVKQVLAHKHE